jgi:hypothetical protein
MPISPDFSTHAIPPLPDEIAQKWFLEIHPAPRRSCTHSSRRTASHRLWMWRWSFSSVRELRDNFKPRSIWCFPTMKETWILEWEADKSTYLLKEFNFRNPLLVTSSKKKKKIERKKWRAELHNMPYNLTISNPGIIAVSSNAYPGWFVFLGWRLGFSGRWSQDLFDGLNKTLPVLQKQKNRLLTRQLIFCLHLYIICVVNHQQNWSKTGRTGMRCHL